MDIINDFKVWFGEFQYWREVIIVLGSTASAFTLWVKRTRSYFIQKIKWLFSKSPYAIIRKEKQNLLSEEENLTLQLSWTIGAEKNITSKIVSESLECDSQTAQHILDKLTSQKLLLMHMLYTGTEYSLTKIGRDYIVNNKLQISLDSFNVRMRGRNEARKIIKEYQDTVNQLGH